MRCFSLLLAHFASSLTGSKHVLTLRILKAFCKGFRYNYLPTKPIFLTTKLPSSRAVYSQRCLTQPYCLKTAFFKVLKN